MANAQQQLIQATNNYDVAEASLNKIIGTSLDTTLKLKDSLQYTPYENDMQYCLDYASMNRAELEQSRLAVDAAKGAVKVLKAAFCRKLLHLQLNLGAVVVVTGLVMTKRTGP